MQAARFAPRVARLRTGGRGHHDAQEVESDSESEEEEEKKTVTFGDDEEDAPKLQISEEDATLDIVEPEVVDPMKELESKVAETLVLNL